MLKSHTLRIALSIGVLATVGAAAFFLSTAVTSPSLAAGSEIAGPAGQPTALPSSATAIEVPILMYHLVDIARAETPPADYELLVGFRGTQSDLSVVDIYELAAELSRHGSTFRRRAALLVVPGINFDRASFFETCAHNRGFSVNAYTDYEEAMRWLLLEEDLPGNDLPAKKVDAGDGK